MSNRHQTDKSLEFPRAVTERGQVLKEATAVPPFGPAYDPPLVQQVDRFDVWGTTEIAEVDCAEF